MFCAAVHNLIAHALTCIWIWHSLKKIHIHHWDLLPYEEQMPSQILFCFLISCSDMNDYAPKSMKKKYIYSDRKVSIFITYSSLLLMHFLPSCLTERVWWSCLNRNIQCYLRCLCHPVWLSTVDLAAYRSHIGHVLCLLAHTEVWDDLCLGRWLMPNF